MHRNGSVKIKTHFPRSSITQHKPNAFLSPTVIKTTLSVSSSSSSSSSSPTKMASPTFNKSKSTQSAVVWDCGSSLYDSFELNSLKRQLDSAIASRSLSMPHLPGRRCLLPPPPPPPSSKKSSKISRSLNKFLRSVFRHKPNSSPGFEANPERVDDGFYFLYEDEPNSLSPVPEVGFSGFSPEIGSLVRRTASERFTAATSMGISCA